MRTLKGSFTIEATLLMSLLIPLLTALIYYGFFLHDCAWIQGAAYEAALETALQGDDQGVISEGTFDKLEKSIQNGKNQVNVSLTESFKMPGMAARFFANSTLEISASKKVKVIHAGERVIQMKALKKIMRGD